MSLRDNLNEVKDKLSNDQNLLVSAFRLESFYKKYKIIIYLLVALVLAFACYKAYAYYDAQKRLERASKIMDEIYSTPATDTAKKEALEKQLQSVDTTLHDFYIYTTLQRLSVLELKDKKNLDRLHSIIDSSNKLISALATYQYATITENLDMLEHFSGDASKLLRDKARFQAAYLYMQEGKISKGLELLNSITLRSDNQDVYNMAMRLKHYGLLERNPILDSKNAIESNKDKDNKAN